MLESWSWNILREHCNAKSQLFCRRAVALVAPPKAEHHRRKLHHSRSNDATSGPSNTAATADIAVLQCATDRKYMSSSILVPTPPSVPCCPHRLIAAAVALPLSLRTASFQWTNRPIIFDKRKSQEIYQGDSKIERALLNPHLPGFVMCQYRWNGHPERAAGTRIPITTRVESDHTVQI